MLALILGMYRSFHFLGFMIASIIFTSEKSTAGLVVGENETLNSCSELVLFDLDKSNIRPEFNNTFVSVLEKAMLSKAFHNLSRWPY